MTHYVVGAYSMLILFGGIMAFLKTGSSASIVSAALSSFVLNICCVSLYKKRAFAYPATLIVLFGLFLLFLWRYLLTGAMMPGGMMSLLSALVWVVVLVAARKFKPGHEEVQ